ncbi:prepilin-type N-terminal cleavage/methylation domain-containing protein [Methylobacterium nonmethylotrophicum]|nr:prepilin-type N-terminal cleavage/methylation domain-containing protein [Methylobacterium nonmethylotrophicum]
MDQAPIGTRSAADARSRSRGFSLLEALAAIALLAIALPATVSVFSGAASRASLADARHDLLRRAEDLVTITRAEFSGRFGRTAGSDAIARWTVETTPLTDPDENARRAAPSTVPVHLKVMTQSRQNVTVALETMFLFREQGR